jgi:tetratricopeptide (TPR) repeat protein
MAERVCADAALPAAVIHGLLTGLAQAGLVRPEPRRGAGRYRMPAAIREFAAARLAEAGEDELLRRRLRDFVAHHVEYLTTIGKARVPLTWPSLQDLFRSYQADARNIRAVLAWCLEHGDAVLGLRICTELGICWMALGQYDEGGRWLGAFLDAGRGPSLPAAVRGPALAVRAQVAIFSSRMAGARTWAAAGLNLCRAAGDTHYTVIALNALSQIELGAANTGAALRLAREALAQARTAGDTWNEVYALNNQAAAQHAAGDLAGARASGDAALALALKTDQHYGAALARLELGDITRALGDTGAARGHLEAVLPFARQGMPQPDTVRCLAGLTAIALDRGDLADARDYLADSLALCLRAGQRAGMAGALLGFAELSASRPSCPRPTRTPSSATGTRWRRRTRPTAAGPPGWS